MTLPVLVTIGPSHYCEKARWALDVKGVGYTEEAHVPMLHWRRLKRHGRRTVPLLELPEGRVLVESTDIVAWADGQGTGPTLMPEDPAVAARVAEQVKRWDDKLGTHGRRCVYGTLLRSPAVTRAAFTAAPRWEQAALRVGFPLWKAGIVKGLGVVPDKVARSKARVEELFDEASALLETHGGFLAGPTFTASDLTFAALSALVILPPEYGAALPDLDELARTGGLPGVEEALAWRDRLRATPAGEHVLRTYREYRRPAGARA